MTTISESSGRLGLSNTFIYFISYNVVRRCNGSLANQIAIAGEVLHLPIVPINIFPSGSQAREKFNVVDLAKLTLISDKKASNAITIPRISSRNGIDVSLIDQVAIKSDFNDGSEQVETISFSRFLSETVKIRTWVANDSRGRTGRPSRLKKEGLQAIELSEIENYILSGKSQPMNQPAQTSISATKLNNQILIGNPVTCLLFKLSYVVSVMNKIATALRIGRKSLRTADVRFDYCFAHLPSHW